MSGGAWQQYEAEVGGRGLVAQLELELVQVSLEQLVVPFADEQTD